MKTVSRFINFALTHLKETEGETESPSEGRIGNYSLQIFEEIDKKSRDGNPNSDEAKLHSVSLGRCTT